MPAVFLPLNGPNHEGKKPKAPAVSGWERPNYRGIDPRTYKGSYGMRCDGLIVIDCDSDEAAAIWDEIIGPANVDRTWVRKTPRGWHFIYRWHDPLGELEHLHGPHAGVLPGIDVRQGASSQIVYSAPGYETLHGSPQTMKDFHPPWAATFNVRARAASQADTWDEMPEGIGNNTMAALAGTMRKQGMSFVTMARCLGAINKITMPTDPMPKQMVLDIVRSVSRYEVDPFIEEIGFDPDV